ncbi:MAG: hypothetical protein K2J37_04720 [Ruminococcus sp.]|nr:hypothetical protein [Ruminococcus sp.]MDE6784351.1 hypothetical protein [Ruminococcus sp.]
MKKGMGKVIIFVLLILFDIISIVIAYGSFIEIKGIISYLIFISILLNIVFIKNCEKKSNKIIMCILLFVYGLSGGLFWISENNSGRNKIEQTNVGKYIYVTYELNPGAMGHFSYEDRVYYSLIDTDLLTVRILKSSEHYRYRG